MAKYEGSCLCGQVTYIIESDAREQSNTKFFHCHCQRCRKTSGTGHASNIIVPNPTRAEWLTGEENIGEYKVPEAVRFRSVFCKACGSSLPRFTKAGEPAVIVAGTLDHEVDVNPQARIFTASKTAWSCMTNDINAFDEYPS